MTHHAIVIIDGSSIRDSVAPSAKRERHAFTVKSPMFKNGEDYAIGQTIHLDSDTAARAKAAGDIE